MTQHVHGKSYEPPADLVRARPLPTSPLAIRIATALAGAPAAYWNHDTQIMAWAQIIQAELEKEHPCPKI